jgi:hypothetical protein
MGGVLDKQLGIAQQTQGEAQAGVQAAGQLQLDGIKNQMDATKVLIVALNENTRALLGQKDNAQKSLDEIAKAQQGGQTAPGVAGSQAAGTLQTGSVQPGQTGGGIAASTPPGSESTYR